MKLEQKLSEMAEKAHDKIDDKLALKWEFVEAYKAGAKAALELQEVKALVEGLQTCEKHCLCNRNTFGFDYGENHKRLGYPRAGARWNSPRDIAIEALSTWKAFKGEENGK